jgi:hypothetical protein
VHRPSAGLVFPRCFLEQFTQTLRDDVYAVPNPVAIAGFDAVDPFIFPLIRSPASKVSHRFRERTTGRTYHNDSALLSLSFGLRCGLWLELRMNFLILSGVRDRGESGWNPTGHGTLWNVRGVVGADGIGAWRPAQRHS